MFLKQQITILECFLMDHVKLKTGKGWKFSFAITGMNYILKQIKLDNNYFKF